jgi:hypothetical protein
MQEVERDVAIADGIEGVTRRCLEAELRCGERALER